MGEGVITYKRVGISVIYTINIEGALKEMRISSKFKRFTEV